MEIIVCSSHATSHAPKKLIQPLLINEIYYKHVTLLNTIVNAFMANAISTTKITKDILINGHHKRIA